MANPKNNPDPVQEHSAGGVVIKKINNDLHVLLGIHSGYKRWVLPKGLIEERETSQETAIREVEEETGVIAKILKLEPIHTLKYSFYADFKDKVEKGIKENAKEDLSTRRYIKYQEGGGKVKVEKTVDFYLMEQVGGSHKDHGWEMSKVEWKPLEEAMKIMGFENEKSVVKKAIETTKG